MNLSKTVELTLAKYLRQNCDLGGDTVVRPWQTLRHEGNFRDDDDRMFPCVEIRAASPKFNDDKVTAEVRVDIACYTKAEDDRDHSVISDTYGQVIEAVYRLYQGACCNGETWQGFKEEVAQEFAEMQSSGLSLGDGDLPADVAGLLVMSIGLTLHVAFKRCRR